MPTLIDVTARLVIRELDMEDVRDYQQLVNECAEGITPDLVGLTAGEFASRHQAYIKYQYGFYGYGIWGIFLKGTNTDYDSYSRANEGRLIGIVGLRNGSDSRIGELSYAIASGYRGRGYASEAVSAALEYGRECGFTSFEAVISPDNTASVNLARKFRVNIIFSEHDKED